MRKTDRQTETDKEGIERHTDIVKQKDRHSIPRTYRTSLDAYYVLSFAYIWGHK